MTDFSKEISTNKSRGRYINLLGAIHVPFPRSLNDSSNYSSEAV